MSRLLLVIACIVSMSLAHQAQSAESRDSNPPIALGVYWPGEFTFRDLQIPKMRWAKIEETLDVLQKNHVNTIWITHVTAEEGAQLARLSEKRGIKLIASLGELDKRTDTGAELRDSILKTWGDAPKPIAWGLGDEPLSAMMASMGPYTKKWQDAGQPVATVVMTGDVPACAMEMKPDIFAVDAYPFFSANNPNGPGDYAASTTYYLDSARVAREWAQRAGVPSWWMMPQIFSEVWGPRDIDKDGNIVYLPGGGPHWRMPTEAEVRWQTWAAVGQGAKGVVFFSLFFDTAAIPEAPQPDPALGFAVKEPTNSGLPSGIMYMDGRPTPLLGAMGGSFDRVTQIAPILGKLKWTDEPLAFTSKGWRPAGQVVQAYVDDSNAAYAVVVSGDLTAVSEIAVNIDPKFSKVTDLLSGEVLPFVQTSPQFEPRGPFKQVKVKLEAGDGTMLKLE